MPIVPGLDGTRHVTTFEDASTALCGEDLTETGAFDPTVAVPATCNPCRIENGRRIRARMNARAEH